jgi:hypothetical protein
MADNTQLNVGTGGDIIATDDIGGVKYQRIKNGFGADGSYSDVSDTNALPALLTATPVSQWPNYSAPDSNSQRSAGIDDFGSLQTRGAVLTDEGTFRCNFANTSTFVSIGSVTVSGSTVTGTGFLAADAHVNDYFKIAADADTFCQQISSIDSDTQITLKKPYTGSASGTGNRSLVFPVTGTGGSQSVASGQLTLTAGTTAASVTGIRRYTDYGPLVYRTRFNISQRIANQSLRAGLREDASTPRWFAWFLLDGITNTTVKCQTGRNPTGSPSAAETQETTITLPNGATSATARDWRVELLTESVRFYIDGVLVAEHSQTIPHQHDEMTSVVEFINGTTPASSTTCVIDYLTGKNHNKLEVGIMSDVEKIVAANAPVEMRTFSQAGVIAINTDLLIIDCAQFRSIGLTCTNMGTSGVVTVFWTNDLSIAGTAGSLFRPSVGSADQVTTFNAAGTWNTPVLARYARVRLTTATTAGTTTITAALFQQLIGFMNQSINSISNTVTTSTGLNASTALVGDVGLQVRANATGAMTTAKVLAAATTNATSAKASAGRVFGWQLTNTTAAAKYVRLYNLATAPTVGTSTPVYNIVLPANATVNASFPMGIAHSTGIAYAITNAIADLDATAVAANDVLGAIYYA